MKILVTGGAGFIGGCVVRHLISGGEDGVVNVDKLTYAANLQSLATVEGHADYAFERVDICDPDALANVFKTHRPDAVMHLAAESHVDRSIDGPAEFIQTNIVGTYQLLDTALRYFENLDSAQRETFRFLHVSTDEVFGELDADAPPFHVDTAYRPRSPYSASKAASDHLALAWHHTYGLPVVLSNCSNNYGPFQFPEKMIPMMIISALNELPLPVYGRGENIRDWLFVEDHAEALVNILKRGELGETYLVGGGAERRNIDIVQDICSVLDEMAPMRNCAHYETLISFVEDRPGHDFRYAIDFSKTTSALDWRPRLSFEDGLRRTVAWYLEHREWWQPLVSERLAANRVGLGRSNGA